MKKNVAQISLTLFISFCILFFVFPEFFSSGVSYVRSDQIDNLVKKIKRVSLPPLDTVAYDKKINELANNPPMPQPALPLPWPVATVYPNAGAILPFKRIIAYYGNLYSKQISVFGQYN